MLGMPVPLPTPWAVQADRSLLVLLAFCGAFASAAIGAVLAASWFWLPLAIVAAAGRRHPGIPPHRRILRRLAADRRRNAGDDAGRPCRPGVVPGHHRGGQGGRARPRAAVCRSATASRLDVFNPALGLRGDVRGRPGARPASRPDAGRQPAFVARARWRRSPSRSAGTVAGWGRAIDAHHRLDAAGLGGRRRGVLDLAGLRPLFVDSGGERLAGLGHPAFLAGFCLAAIYACLIELYRDGRSRWLLLLAANFLILVLTGARAPLAYAHRGDRSDPRLRPRPAHSRGGGRILLILLAACLLPLLVVLASDLPDGAAVQCAEQRRRQPQRPRDCCGRRSSRPPRRRPGSAGGSAPAMRSSRRTASWRG